ncbi:MAG: hypothetical protein JJ992_09835 [Planctomycetes bacterium]|nr:hypothetical protein [Planctomycetota bacterium]
MQWSKLVPICAVVWASVALTSNVSGGPLVYGVLANLPKTEIMRPEVDEAKWE